LDKILMTGGAGFIGSNIARLAIQKGYYVRVLDNLSTGSKANLKGLPVELVNGTVTNRELVERSTKDVKYIFHQAAISASPMFVPDPSEGITVNELGFSNIMAAAIRNGTQKVVYAMTSTMYGNSPTPWKEDQVLVSNVPNIYSSTLLSRAFIAKQLEETTGTKTAGLVYFSVYGPYESAKGRYANIVSRFLWNIKLGKSPILYGDGSQTRDFVHVEDVARANFLAAESKFSGSFVNVGTGHETSMKQIALSLCEIMSSEIQPIYKPNPIYGYCERTCAETSKAKSQIGFGSSISIAEGLKSLVSFYQEDEKRIPATYD
jgi:UDP-glucose 4-epimerase